MKDGQNDLIVGMEIYLAILTQQQCHELRLKLGLSIKFDPFDLLFY